MSKSSRASAPNKDWFITTFYRFQAVDDPGALKAELVKLAKALGLKGLVILAHEGINSTLAAPSLQALDELKMWVQKWFGEEVIEFKDSYASQPQVFAHFKVKIRPEIVTLGAPELVPTDKRHRHLSPKEWHEALHEENVVVIDTRNEFEVQMGSFKGAINPHIEAFSEFPDRVERDLKIPKDKKVLIFCTGGIRCEKGILEMERRGYKEVYQLQGGILNYLKERPNEDFEGECFVFDDRVAVDQNLNPSKKYALCPHCGSPGWTWVNCPRCDKPQILCNNCIEVGGDHHTCSKECANHFRLRPWQKKGQRRTPRPESWPKA